MDELLAKLTGSQLIGLAAVVMGPLIAIVAVVANQWRRVRVAEVEGALKQQMLDKGMSAAEIEQVMRARPGSGAAVSSGDEAQDRAALVQRMVDEGYEGADIERVLKAYQPPAKSGDEKPYAHKV